MHWVAVMGLAVKKCALTSSYTDAQVDLAADIDIQDPHQDSKSLHITRKILNFNWWQTAAVIVIPILCLNTSLLLLNNSKYFWSTVRVMVRVSCIISTFSRWRQVPSWSSGQWKYYYYHLKREMSQNENTSIYWSICVPMLTFNELLVMAKNWGPENMLP